MEARARERVERARSSSSLAAGALAGLAETSPPPPLIVKLSTMVSAALNNGIRLADEWWQCLQVCGSEDVVFFADADHIFLDVAEELHRMCTQAGLHVQVFQYTYPPMDPDDKYRVPTSVKTSCPGATLYRGSIVGLRVGECSTPTAPPRKKSRR